MQHRASTRATLASCILTVSLAACGSSSTPSETETVPETDLPTTTAATTSVTEPIVDSVPVTEVATTPTTPSSETTTSTTVPPGREPSPPLTGATDLLVEGITPLPDVGLPGFAPPTEAGRYHSYRLGTEIVFDVPGEFTLGQHGPGTIAWDLGADRIVFISRWGADEPLGPDEWVDELLASGWDVVESDDGSIGDHAVRRFDITPTSARETIGGVVAQGALGFGDGLPRRVWIIDQSDGLPIVVGSGLPDDEWGEYVDGVVASIELGPTHDDPRTGRDPIEYGGPFWTAEPRDRYRTLLFDDAVITLADEISGLAGGQNLSMTVPGEFTGTEPPTAAIGAVGQLILPPDNPAAGLFASTIIEAPVDAAALLDHVASLAERGLITNVRDVDTSAMVLGATTASIEFDVPAGDEVGMFLSQPDGWTALTVETLDPATTYRLWTADIGDQVAATMVRADLGNSDDLDHAAIFAETLMTSFTRG